MISDRAAFAAAYLIVGLVMLKVGERIAELAKRPDLARTISVSRVIVIRKPDLHELLVGCDALTIDCSARRTEDMLEEDADTKRDVTCTCVEVRPR